MLSHKLFTARLNFVKLANWYIYILLIYYTLYDFWFIIMCPDKETGFYGISFHLIEFHQMIHKKIIKIPRFTQHITIVSLYICKQGLQLRLMRCNCTFTLSFLTLVMKIVILMDMHLIFCNLWLCLNHFASL